MSPERLIAAIGTGWPKDSKDEPNAISTKIIQAASELVAVDSKLLIVGGNGQGLSDNDHVCELPEAWRMRNMLSTTAPEIARKALTDCDLIFRHEFKLDPSHNTIQNAQNIVAVVRKMEAKYLDVVAHDDHLTRVIGTIRKQLQEAGLIETVTMRGYPIKAPFESNNAQVQLRSWVYFKIWTLLSDLHHVIMGKVPRAEYIKERVLGKNYDHLKLRAA